MVNKYGVTYLSAGELREALKDVPDDACVSLCYVADCEGFKNVLHSNFAQEARFINYGPELDPNLSGHEFRISTREALTY